MGEVASCVRFVCAALAHRAGAVRKRSVRGCGRTRQCWSLPREASEPNVRRSRSSGGHSGRLPGHVPPSNAGRARRGLTGVELPRMGLALRRLAERVEPAWMQIADNCNAAQLLRLTASESRYGGIGPRSATASGAASCCWQ